jgi:hypothetical protein
MEARHFLSCTKVIELWQLTASQARFSFSCPEERGGSEEPYLPKVAVEVFPRQLDMHAAASPEQLRLGRCGGLLVLPSHIMFWCHGS